MQMLEIDLDDQVSKIQLLSNDPFKWRCFFLAILLPFLSSAQIVVSNEKGKAIAYVEVRKMNGALIALSTYKGEISFRAFDKAAVSEADSVRFVHPGFEPVFMSVSAVKKLSIVRLTPKAILLDEIRVVAKRSVKYICLTGYFRSYQRTNEEITSYSDGQVAILFDLDLREMIGNKRLEERSWVRFNEKKEFPLFNVIGPPIPSVPDRSLSPVKQDAGYWILDTPHIHADNQPIHRKSAIGESHHDYHHEKFYFKSHGSDQLGLENLKFHQEIRKYRMKRRSEVDFASIEVVWEFVVEQVDYIEEKPKGFSDYTGFRDRSAYSTRFCEKKDSDRSFWLTFDILQSTKNLTELPNSKR